MSLTYTHDDIKKAWMFMRIITSIHAAALWKETILLTREKNGQT